MRRGFLELMDTMPQAENHGRVFFLIGENFFIDVCIFGEMMFVYLGI